MRNIHLTAWGLAVAGAALALDQVSKWYILHEVALPFHNSIEITPFFSLSMVWNQGISFGMLSKYNQPVLLIALAAVISTTLLAWLYRAPSRFIATALGLVLGGATGNIIDRVRFNAVVDFLDFHIGDYHWPAFNIADSTIFIGVVLLCASSMFTPSPKAKGLEP